MIYAALLLLNSLAGKDWGVTRTTYTDAVTGLRVDELTGPEGKAKNLYYHFSNFTADNRFVILAMERGGAWQIYRSEVATGRLVQLTDEPGVAAASAVPHPRDARLVYFLKGYDVVELDILEFRRRKVGTIPGPIVGGSNQPSVSHDLKSLAVSKQRDAANWEIGLMDIATGAWRTVTTVGFRVGHLQHHPKLPLLFYVWETGGYAPQRSWVVNADGTGNRPFYYRTDRTRWFTPLKEWMTHEAWVPETGEMTMIMDKVGIVAVKPDGESRIIVYGNYWHTAARGDGKWLVADDFEGRVWLIEAATGNTRLLATGARGDRSTHAEPSFDRQGRYVLFNSSRTHPTVAVVEIPKD